MKKSLMLVVVLSGLITMYSCKDNKKQEEQATETTTQAEPETKQQGTSAAEPKTFSVTAAPDTISLGKNKEALLRLKNLKAIELSNPDGQVTGIEFSYDFEVTNKNAIGQPRIFVNPADFRLELDNGTKISHDTYNSVTVDAESTVASTGDKFKLPAGTKPTALNLFYDETRVSVKLELR